MMKDGMGKKFKEWMLKWSNKKFKNTMFLTHILSMVRVVSFPLLFFFGLFTQIASHLLRNLILVINLFPLPLW